MAFIPDEVDRRHREITPNARTVYGAHCALRRHAYRVSFATNEEIAAGWNLSLGSVRNAMTELRRKGWVSTVAHYTELLVGDFSPVDKQHPRREVPAGPLFRRPVRTAPDDVHDSMISNHETVIPDHETVSGNHETVNENHDSMISNHETVNSHIEDRARVPSQLQPLPAHTPARPPLALVTPTAAGERVCECGLNVSLELLRRYARNQPQPLGEGWVGKAFDECFRHAQVREWLEKQNAPTAAKPGLLDPKDCPDCAGTLYIEPGGPGKGVKKCPHAGLYAQLAETVQARAHAPP